MASPLQNAEKIASSAPVPTRPATLGRVLDAPNRAIDPAREPYAREIADYIVKEMIANTDLQSPDFIRVSGLFQAFRKSNEAPALRVTALLRALYEFKKLVDYGQKWDQKKFITNTWGKVSLLSGAQIEYDVWSNIHYGFVGRQIGFNSEVLLTAAGYAQAVGSEIPRGWFERWVNGQVQYLGQALDDPVDQVAISIGMQLSDTHSRKIQTTDVIAALKNSLQQLSRK